jgi:hypothetical protein
LPLLTNPNFSACRFILTAISNDTFRRAKTMRATAMEDMIHDIQQSHGQAAIDRATQIVKFFYNAFFYEAPSQPPVLSQSA